LSNGLETTRRVDVIVVTKRSPNAKHLESNFRVTTEYRAWRQMRYRCNASSGQYYVRYKLRGIKVCERWNLYENFLKDMGRRPDDKSSLDRIDNDGDYEPGNCRWATHKEQNRNTSGNNLIECDGEVKTVTEWSSIYGLNIKTIPLRIKRGWSPESAIKTPGIETFEFDGVTKTYSQWAKEYGIDRGTLRSRVKSGWSFSDAVSKKVKKKRGSNAKAN